MFLFCSKRPNKLDIFRPKPYRLRLEFRPLQGRRARLTFAASALPPMVSARLCFTDFQAFRRPFHESRDRISGSSDRRRSRGEKGASRSAVELAPFPFGKRVVLGPARKLRRLDADRAVDHQLEELLDRIDEGRPGVDRKQRQAKRRSRVRQVDGRADSLAERSLDRGAMVRLVRDLVDVDDEVGRIISMRIEIEMKQKKELKCRSVRRGTILLDEPVGQQAREGVAPGAGQRSAQHVHEVVVAVRPLLGVGCALIEGVADEQDVTSRKGVRDRPETSKRPRVGQDGDFAARLGAANEPLDKVPLRRLERAAEPITGKKPFDRHPAIVAGHRPVDANERRELKKIRRGFRVLRGPAGKVVFPQIGGGQGREALVEDLAIGDRRRRGPEFRPKPRARRAPARMDEHSRSAVGARASNRDRGNSGLRNGRWLGH